MNLTKKQSLAILLSTLLFVTTSSSIYLLTPYPGDVSTVETSSNHSVETTELRDNKDKQESIKTSNNIVIENIKLLNKNSSLSATIKIPTSDIYLASEQLFNKINNPKILNPKVEILDNSIKLSLNYKLVGSFYTSFMCNLLTTVRDNTIYVSVSNVSIGKIHIHDNLVDFALNKVLKGKKVSIKYDDCTFSYDISKEYPSLSINNFSINDNNISIDLAYEFLDILSMGTNDK